MEASDFATTYTKRGLTEQEYTDVVDAAEKLLEQMNPSSIKNRYTDVDVESASLVLAFCRTEEVPVWWARMILANEGLIRRDHKLASVVFEKAHQHYWRGRRKHR